MARPKSWGSPESLRGPYALRRGSRRGSCPRLAASDLAWASFSLAIAAPLAAALLPIRPIRSRAPVRAGARPSRSGLTVQLRPLAVGAGPRSRLGPGRSAPGPASTRASVRIDLARTVSSDTGHAPRPRRTGPRPARPARRRRPPR